MKHRYKCCQPLFCSVRKDGTCKGAVHFLASGSLYLLMEFATVSLAFLFPILQYCIAYRDRGDREISQIDRRNYSPNPIPYENFRFGASAGDGRSLHRSRTLRPSIHRLDRIPRRTSLFGALDRTAARIPLEMADALGRRKSRASIHLSQWEHFMCL